MRRYYSIILIICALGISSSACQAVQVKEPAVAGAFYPADAAVLKKSVDALLAAAQPSASELSPMALVVPHAAHQYSGALAARAYARLKGRRISTVIMLGPSHHALVKGAAILPGDGMRTPLGVVSINTHMARSLISEAAHIRLDAAPFAREHSLEVQLPFVQRILGHKVQVVPILVGMPDRESFAALSSGIARILMEDPEALLVISTDLSHFHDQATSNSMDSGVIDAMERLAIPDLERMLSSGKGEMCGGWPTVYGLAAARAAGASHAVSYGRGSSGDLTGDRQRVVGYVSMGIVRGRLSDQQRHNLLELARLTVNRHVRGEKLPDATTTDPLLKADRGVFVTIKTPDGHLRGCIGSIVPEKSLQESVIQNAVAAAARDQRFKPVRPEELAGLQYEVTVLSPLEPLSDPTAIQVGRHGLYLEKGPFSSVFLPQVPLEQGWDRSTYLAELARKAGLAVDGWKDARLSVFTADVIK